MIYSTLKANKEHNISYATIIEYYDLGIGCVGALFDDKYVEDEVYTSDTLYDDFTERQIASACLKALRKDEDILVYNKMIFDLNLPELIYDDLEDLIAEGAIGSSRDLREINVKARKKGCTIQKEERYGENNIYCRFLHIDDLIDKYFPCYADLNDDYCNNCGNCH